MLSHLFRVFKHRPVLLALSQELEHAGLPCGVHSYDPELSLKTSWAAVVLLVPSGSVSGEPRRSSPDLLATFSHSLYLLWPAGQSLGGLHFSQRSICTYQP